MENKGGLVMDNENLQQKKSSKLGCFLAIIIPIVAFAIFVAILQKISGNEVTSEISLPILFSFLILSFCVFMLVKTITIKKEKKKVLAEKKQGLNFMKHIVVQHIAGLSIPESATCAVYLCNDRIVIERNETTFNLPMTKISDIVIKTETEIQKSYTSSVGGAVGGALLFGPLGAIVGGRSKKKTDKIIHQYLIIAYDKENVIDYISFDCTNQYQAGAFVDYFKKIPKVKTEINL